MSRNGAVEVLPSKIYQRGQFLTWPAHQKWKLLNDLNITTVVNLWSKADPDLSCPELNFCYLNWVCSPSEVPPEADDFVAFIVGRLDRKGGAVLIHCEAGRGRSVWLTTRVLAEFKGIPRKAALEIVAEKINHNLTKALLEDLK